MTQAIGQKILFRHKSTYEASIFTPSHNQPYLCQYQSVCHPSFTTLLLSSIRHSNRPSLLLLLSSLPIELPSLSPVLSKSSSNLYLFHHQLQTTKMNVEQSPAPRIIGQKSSTDRKLRRYHPNHLESNTKIVYSMHLVQSEQNNSFIWCDSESTAFV